MPAPLTGRAKKTEAVWSALRAHIIKERQKKKQEQEADAEVERQRKERERQQKQDVMTLGETREQIQHLENRLSQLKEEKHQLFLQLKKVLNEDDNRRRQLVKESNDMMGMHGYAAGAVTLSGHPQLFLQPNMSLSGRTALYKLPPGHGQHSLLPPVSEYDLLSNGLARGALKRSRSPSPPQNYHPSYNYKPGSIPHYTQQKLDDGRRGHEYSRAVLWNKNPPSSPYGSAQSGAYYSHPPVSQVTSTTVSYAPTPAQTVYSYANSGHPQYAQPPPGAPAPPRDEAGKHASAGIFLPHGQAPPQQAPGPTRSIPQHGQAYVGLHPQLEHGSQKPSFSAQEAEKYYAVAPSHPSGVTIRPATHVPIHGGSIPIQQAPQGAKSGSITSGYPIRGQPSPHVTSGSYQPTVSTSHSVYVSQAPAARLSYSQPTSQPPHPSSHVQNAGPPTHGAAPGHGPSPGRYNVPGLQREV